MDMEVLGNREWRELGKRFSKVAKGKEMRRNLTKRAQAAAKPAVTDVKAAVLRIDSRGVKGRGTLRRERSYGIRTPKGRVRAFGLRQTVARLVKSRVKYSGNTVGLRVSVDSSQMPRTQRRLPAHLDNPKGWRHPVWGHRTRRWSQQYGGPYFARTLMRHTPKVRDELQTAVTETLKELQT